MMSGGTFHRELVLRWPCAPEWGLRRVGVAGLDGGDDGVVASDVHVPTARSWPANMIDIRIEPSSASQVCRRDSLPVSRHRARWNARSDSMRCSRLPAGSVHLGDGREARDAAARSGRRGTVGRRAPPGRRAQRRRRRSPSGRADARTAGRGSGPRQALLLQLTHRFAQGAAADCRAVGQLGLHHLRLRRDLATGDGTPQ